MMNSFNSGSGLVMCVTCSILIRWCVSFGSYSGEGKSPIFGDYEAQRHWQEITYNLPVKQWYTNSSDNDLQYWGLDYPPLTAYHSWLCGYIANLIDPEWVSLFNSRGYESDNHKVFMRYSVLVVDIAIFYPALIFLIYLELKSSGNYSIKPSHYPTTDLVLPLLYPGIILIDYGHFQYNNISLGFLIGAVLFFSQNLDIFGSIAFCLSLNYKQMELYHALPIFFYLLGKCLKKSTLQCVLKLTKLAVTVVISFGILWYPYLDTVDTFMQVLGRLFPVNRGLFEDKVANVWCSLSPVIKFKEIWDQQAMFKICAITTLLASLPSCLHVLAKPTVRNLKMSLVNVSLIFFLFSFQVHEKSILIAGLSCCLIYSLAPNLFVSWFLHVTVFSMSPLLRKDGLILQQLAVLGIFLIISHKHHGYNKKSFEAALKSIGFIKMKSRVCSFLIFLFRAMFWISTFINFALVILPDFYQPPKKYPDLISVMTSTLSCALFLMFSVLFYIVQFSESVDKRLHAKHE